MNEQSNIAHKLKEINKKISTLEQQIYSNGDMEKTLEEELFDMESNNKSQESEGKIEGYYIIEDKDENKDGSKKTKIDEKSNQKNNDQDNKETTTNDKNKEYKENK